MSDRAREFLTYTMIVVGGLLVLGAGAFYAYAALTPGVEVPPGIVEVLGFALVAIAGALIGRDGAKKAERVAGVGVAREEIAAERLAAQDHKLTRIEAAQQREEESQQRINDIDGKLGRIESAVRGDVNTHREDVR